MVERFPSAYRGSSPVRGYAWLIAMVGFIVLMSSAVVYFFMSRWSVSAQIGIILGLVLLLGAVLLRPDVVRAILAGRPVKYASNALVMSLAFVGILGLINFLAVKHDWEYDATENGQFTLSEQTIQLLRNLDRPVQVIGFFQSGDPRQTLAEDYLARCSSYTNLLTYEFLDPNIEPAIARSYDLKDYGLVFVSGSNSVEILGVDETSITSGLIRVIRDQEKRVYFATGHGEPNISDNTSTGYSNIRQVLENENYIVETINLAAASDISTEAAALILAGGKGELFASEQEFIDEWVNKGGKLMVLIDPLKPVPLANLLQRYGLTVGDDLVADEDNHLVGLAPTSPLIVQYPAHQITRGLDGYLTFFPLARSLQINESRLTDTWSTEPILTTGPNSWAETNLEQLSQLEYNEGIDIPGPIHIGAAAYDRESGTRMVVFGSADFISNKNLLDEVANRDLFMNAVNWLTEDQNLLPIRPKDTTNRRLFLTPLQSNIVIFTSLIFIPSAVLVIGAAVWWKRR